MLYTRSSFINYLINVHDCEIITKSDGSDRFVHIKNGPAKAYLWAGGKDQIDYETIQIVCNKLWLPYLPGHSDLEPIE